MTREEVKRELLMVMRGNKKFEDLPDEIFEHEDIMGIFEEIKWRTEQEELVNENDYVRDMEEGLI